MRASQVLAQVDWTTWWSAFWEGIVIFFSPTEMLVSVGGMVALGLLGLGWGCFPDNLISSAKRRLWLTGIFVAAIAISCWSAVEMVELATGSVPTLGAFFVKGSLANIYVGVAGMFYVLAIVTGVLIAYGFKRLDVGWQPRQRRYASRTRYRGW